MMLSPDWRVTLDGKEIDTSDLITLSITDNKGMELDTVTLTLSDRKGLLAVPRKGVTLSVAIGYKGQALVDRGTYVVGDVGLSGPPDYLIIGGKSANLDGSDLKAGKEKSWRNISLGGIIRTIAAAHKLEAQISATLAAKKIAHIDQTESDAHFITRLAQEHDALASIKAGRLLFIASGASKTASGQAIPPLVITRNREQDSHDWRAADTGRYTGVQATWHSTKNGKRAKVQVGQDGYRKHISGVYASKALAQQAATAHWQRMQRQFATIELTLAQADPSLFAQTPLQLVGWDKPEIDAAKWIVKSVTLDITTSGLSAKLSAETMTD